MIPDVFGIGVPAFAAESGSDIVRSRSTLPGSDLHKTEPSDFSAFSVQRTRQVSCVEYKVLFKYGNQIL